MFREVADIQTADMLKLPVPKVEYHTEVLEPSKFQRDMLLSLADRAEAVRAGSVKPTEDNMLRITGDGRKLALDQRMLNSLLPDDPMSKANACVDHVLRIWRDTAAEKLTQLLFCDLSTPRGEGFHVYQDIKEKLVRAGYRNRKSPSSTMRIARPRRPPYSARYAPDRCGCCWAPPPRWGLEPMCSGCWLPSIIWIVPGGPPI